MANKLGSKILDFLRFDNEEEFDDDFYEDENYFPRNNS